MRGLGNGDTSPDWEITGPESVNIRDERSVIGRWKSLHNYCSV